MYNDEIWKPIKNYNDFYEISNYGRVRSLTRTVIFKNGNKRIYNGKILTPKKNDKDEYLRIILHDSNGVNKTYTIHRLVAEAFIDNPEKLLIVNHIDGNKRNNYYKNLEWCTSQYNNKHAIITGLNHININGILQNNIENMKRIALIKNNKILKISDCSRHLAEWMLDNNIVDANIETVSRVARRVASGNKKSYFGYKFQYI